jgi:hypothetical protein
VMDSLTACIHQLLTTVSRRLCSDRLPFSTPTQASHTRVFSLSLCGGCWEDEAEAGSCAFC